VALTQNGAAPRMTRVGMADVIWRIGWRYNGGSAPLRARRRMVRQHGHQASFGRQNRVSADDRLWIKALKDNQINGLRDICRLAETRKIGRT